MSETAAVTAAVVRVKESIVTSDGWLVTDSAATVTSTVVVSEALKVSVTVRVRVIVWSSVVASGAVQVVSSASGSVKTPWLLLHR